jgi:hypothetical protein
MCGAILGVLCLISSASEKELANAEPGADEKQFEAWWENL